MDLCKRTEENMQERNGRRRRGRGRGREEVDTGEEMQGRGIGEKHTRGGEM